MCDSSDFEASTSKESQMESETEAQIVAETRFKSIEEQNEALRKENSTLKSQFEHASRLAANIDLVTQKNNELTTHLVKMQEEKEDLLNRVDIAIKTNDELTKRLNDEQHAFSVQRQSDTMGMKKEIKRIQKEYNMHNESLYKQLQEMQDLNQKYEIDRKKLVTQFNRLMDSADNHFNTQFKSLEDLIVFLNTPAVSIEIEKKEVNPSQNEVVLLHQKQIKKLKTKLKTTKKERDDLEGELTQLQKEYKEKCGIQEQEIQKIQSRIKQIQEDHSLLDIDQKHQITVLESKVAAQKEEITRLKTQNNEAQQKQIEKSAPPATPQPVIISAPPQQEKSQKCYEMELATEQLMQRNAEITTQLKQSQDKNIELAQRIKDDESKYDELRITFENLKAEYNSLVLVYENTSKEVDSMRTALHSKKSQKEAKAKKKQIHILKADIADKEQLIASLQAQVQEISLSNEQSLQGLAEQTNKLETLMKEKGVADETIRSLQDEVRAIRQQIIERQIPTADDFFPSQFWSTQEFGPSISSSIDKIARTGAQPSTKIQQIYRILAKYLKERIDELQNELNIANTENQLVKEKTNRFLINTSILFGLQAITIDGFMNKDEDKLLNDNLTHFKSVYDESKRLNDLYSCVVQHFVQTFETTPTNDPNVVFKQITEVRVKMNDYEKINYDNEKQAKYLKSSLRKLQKKFDRQLTQSQLEVESLQKQLEEVTKIAKESTAANQRLKRELQTAKTELRDTLRIQEESENVLKEQHEQFIRISRLEKNKIENELREQVKLANEKIASLTSTNNENEQVIARLKKSVQSQKVALYERDSEIEKLKSESTESEQTMTERHEKEKALLTDSYEKAIAEIRSQCVAQREDVAKLVRDLATAEKKCKRMKSTTAQAKRETERLTNEISNMKEKSERDKKLQESAAKAQVLAAESNYTAKLDEHKSQWESEKRRIFAYATDAFHQFFNPLESIDENTFKTVIQKANAELNRLYAADEAIRKLVGAGSRQKTDDAVAQVVMNS